MARRGGLELKGLVVGVRSLGEQIGNELGRIIADTVNRHLESTIDVNDIVRRAGAGGGKRGRKRSSEKSTCSEPGCGNPVLAKGLCRSHYYRARYRSQKGGGRGKRAAKADGKKARARKAPAAAAASGEGDSSAG